MHRATSQTALFVMLLLLLLLCYVMHFIGPEREDNNDILRQIQVRRFWIIDALNIALSYPLDKF